MEQNKPLFSSSMDVMDFVENNFIVCPNRSFGTVDFLILLYNEYPMQFTQALWHLEIDESEFVPHLDDMHRSVTNVIDQEIDVVSSYQSSTNEFDDFLQEIMNVTDGLDQELGMTDILHMMIKGEYTLAGVILSQAQEGEYLGQNYYEISRNLENTDQEANIREEFYKAKRESAAMQNVPARREDVSEGEKTEEQAIIEQCTVDMTARAKGKGYDPVIGRDEEIKKAARTLLRKKKSNPVFVGESGVGKTAVAEGVVQAIAEGHVPKELKNKTVLSVDIGAMIAGTSNRGEFEEKLKVILEHAQSEGAILFIDEIHMIVGAGSSRGGTDMSNIMKPYLTDSQNPLYVMGATTFDDFKRIENDPAMVRRFAKIVVAEPSPELAVEMIKGQRATYESHHAGIRLTDEAIEAAVELTDRHIHDECLPDKAFAVLDSALAAQRDGFVPENGQKGVVGESDVYAQVSEDLGREIGPLNDPKVKEKMLGLADRFNAVVINQEHATAELSRRVRNSSANLFASARKNKTQGSFMFVGPTGVGKTELSKQLANELGVPLIRYDMSEFGESAAVKRFIGADPSYVGYEEGGQLINDIRANPSCVLLLDEIEKAHPDVYKILLQVMDDAKLKDGKGRVADFQGVYVIMTSNIGANLEEIRGIGFGAETQTVEDQRIELVRQVFSPEFVGRMDASIDFNDLDEVEHFVKILDVHLQPQLDDLADKGIKVKFQANAKKYLAEKCLETKLGARPLKKALEDYFQSPLIDAFYESSLDEGDTVIVRAPKNDNDALDIKYQKPEPKRLMAPNPAKA